MKLFARLHRTILDEKGKGLFAVQALPFVLKRMSEEVRDVLNVTQRACVFDAEFT